MTFGFARRETPQADLSVVIPLYNHERYVGEAIESVLRQTARPREIICIDDGSSDGSARLVQELARREPLIRFSSRPNRGANRTINEGIEAAQGRYVAVLNSDDRFHPSRLARCVAALDADDRLSAVVTDLSFIDAAGGVIANAWYEAARAFHREVGDLGLALANGNFLMTTSNLVARRSLFAEIGPFDDLRYAHDLDFFLRLVAQSKRLTFIREPLLSYRFHGSNTISEAQPKVKAEWAAAVAFYARRVAAGADPSRRGPAYLGRLLDIADRHRLTRLVTMVLLRLDEKPAATPGACLADLSFAAGLQAAAA